MSCLGGDSSLCNVVAQVLYIVPHFKTGNWPEPIWDSLSEMVGAVLPHNCHQHTPVE
jgi:hypothetical protein